MWGRSLSRSDAPVGRSQRIAKSRLAPTGPLALLRFCCLLPPQDNPPPENAIHPISARGFHSKNAVIPSDKVFLSEEEPVLFSSLCLLAHRCFAVSLRCPSTISAPPHSNSCLPSNPIVGTSSATVFRLPVALSLSFRLLFRSSFGILLFDAFQSVTRHLSISAPRPDS